MAVEIQCPECDNPLKVPENILGKKIKCKECGTAFVAKDPRAKPTKPGGAAKPTKPGAGVKVKKEPEPEPEPKKPEPAPYKMQDDDDDEGAKPNPLGIIDEGEDVPRCPHCAKELEPRDAVVCIHCGFNNVTRVKAESKKVWAPDSSDWMNHLGPGVIALVLFIGLVVFDIVCLVSMRDWLTGTFLQKEEKGADGDIAFYVKPGAFITLIWAATVLPIIGTARFAIRRLAIDYMPTEKLKK